MKEKQIAKKKKRSFLNVGPGVVILAGLISMAAAVCIGFGSWEKPERPEVRNNVVSYRIIDVPYSGQILKNDKVQTPKNSSLTAKRATDSLPTQDLQAALPLEEPSGSKKGPDITGTIPEDESSQTPTKLKNKFVAVMKSLDDVSVKAKAVAAEIPELRQQETAMQALDGKSVVEEQVFKEKALFTIQVGVFRNEAYAHRKAAKLSQLDYPSFIQEIVGKDQHLLYLVCFGRFPTRKEAASAKAVFKEKENMDAVVALLKSP